MIEPANAADKSDESEATEKAVEGAHLKLDFNDTDFKSVKLSFLQLFFFGC